MSPNVKSLKETLLEVRKNNELVIATNRKLMKDNSFPASNRTLESTNQLLLEQNKQIEQHLNSEQAGAENNKPEQMKPTTPEWMHHYSVLNDRDRNDPIGAIVDFASQDYLFNDRNELSLFFAGAMESSVFEDDDPQQKRHRIYFYESVLRLIESAHLVREMYLKQELKLPK